jgi:CRISPR-associated protein Cas1
MRSFGAKNSKKIFHDSAENPFNLSDDIIEPFRPYVDIIVVRYCASSGAEELTVDVKKELVGVLAQELRLGAKRYSVGGAISVVTQRVGTAIENNSVSGIELPAMVKNDMISF